MKLLVTGGAGFIGSAVVRLAVARGHQVVNVDALTYAANVWRTSPVADSPLYAFVQADIRDRAALGCGFAAHQPDIVMHLGRRIPCRPLDRWARRFYRHQYYRHVQHAGGARKYWRSGGAADGFAFIISRRRGVWLAARRPRVQFTERPQPTIRAAPIRPRKPRQTIWCALGTRPMACPWC